MKSYILESGQISSSQNLQIIVEFLHSQQEIIQLYVPALFNGEERIINLMKSSSKYNIDHIIDELRNEHIMYIYALFEAKHRAAILINVQQAFNLLEDRVKAIWVLKDC